jgi:hypothetical protein
MKSYVYLPHLADGTGVRDLYTFSVVPSIIIENIQLVLFNLIAACLLKALNLKFSNSFILYEVVMLTQVSQF